MKRPEIPTLDVHIPRRFRRLRDRVMKRDAEFFARHPGVKEYKRPYVPGETWPVHSDAVTAVRMAPGYRVRMFIEERAR